MSSDLRLDVLDRDVMHGGKRRVSISCSREVENKDYLIDPIVQRSNTNASYSSGAPNDASVNESFFESAGEDVDRGPAIYLALLPVTSRSGKDLLNAAGFVLTLGPEEIKQNRELLKLVLDKCTADSSSSVLSASATVVHNRSIDVAPRVVALSTRLYF